MLIIWNDETLSRASFNEYPLARSFRGDYIISHWHTKRIRKPLKSDVFSFLHSPYKWMWDSIWTKVVSNFRSGNEIMWLNATILEHLPALETLDLSNNVITDIPADAFPSANLLKHVWVMHLYRTDWYWFILIRIPTCVFVNNVGGLLWYAEPNMKATW